MSQDFPVVHFIECKKSGFIIGHQCHKSLMIISIRAALHLSVDDKSAPKVKTQIYTARPMTQGSMGQCYTIYYIVPYFLLSLSGQCRYCVFTLGGRNAKGRNQGVLTIPLGYP